MIEEIWQAGGTGNNEILTLPRIPSGRAQHTFPLPHRSPPRLQQFCADINENLCACVEN